jgi:hypothetical protein
MAAPKNKAAKHKASSFSGMISKKEKNAVAFDLLDPSFPQVKAPKEER